MARLLLRHRFATSHVGWADAPRLRSRSNCTLQDSSWIGLKRPFWAHPKLYVMWDESSADERVKPFGLGAVRFKQGELGLRDMS